MTEQWAQFIQILNDTPKTISFEERELLVQYIVKQMRDASVEELRVARARLADWLVSAAPKVAQRKDDPYWTRGWQSGLLRAQLIHTEIERREESPAPSASRWRIFGGSGVSEHRVACLSGLHPEK